MISLFFFCFLYYTIAVIVIAIGYHRCLTHKSLQLNKRLFRLFILLGLPAGTPIQWVGNHRFHHMHTDEELDPHSPIISGFWFAHCGWYLNTKNPIICFLYAIAGPIRLIIDAIHRPVSNQQYNYLAEDISKNKFNRWVSKPYIFRFILFFHLVVPCLFTFYFWGVLRNYILEYYPNDSLQHWRLY